MFLQNLLNIVFCVPVYGLQTYAGLVLQCIVDLCESIHDLVW